MHNQNEARPLPPDGKKGPRQSDHRQHLDAEQARVQGLISRQVAALMAGVSLRHFDRLVKSGRTPKPIRFGRLVRFNEADFRDWIARNCPWREQWLRLRRDERRAR